MDQGNSSVGNWTLDVAKSKYSPGPAPTSSALKIEADGMGADPWRRIDNYTLPV